MQLRHISPRSLEWTEALGDEAGAAPEALSPEDMQRLRAEEEMDRAWVGMKATPSPYVKPPPAAQPWDTR